MVSCWAKCLKNHNLITMYPLDKCAFAPSVSSKYDAGSTLNTAGEGLAASVEVTKLALGNGVVGVNSGGLEFVFPEHTVEVVNTGGRENARRGFRWQCPRMRQRKQERGR